MNAARFCELLQETGFDFASGVPCSILTGIINCLADHEGIRYIPATREDEALGIATGACLAGRVPLVLMQNSGLSHAINPLTSLNIPYRIPLLLVISWRGYQGKDAPEHIIMGEATPRLLEDIGVPAFVVEPDDPAAALRAAVASLQSRQKPAAIILRRDVIT